MAREHSTRVGDCMRRMRRAVRKIQNHSKVGLENCVRAARAGSEVIPKGRRDVDVATGCLTLRKALKGWRGR